MLQIIADNLGIHTFSVETDRGWESRDGGHTRAFLTVGSREEGTDLIERIGQIGDMELEAQWKQYSETELLRTSDLVAFGARFPATASATPRGGFHSVGAGFIGTGGGFIGGGWG